MKIIQNWSLDYCQVRKSIRTNKLLLVCFLASCQVVHVNTVCSRCSLSKTKCWRLRGSQRRLTPAIIKKKQVIRKVL